MTILSLILRPQAPLEAECLSPDRLRGLSEFEIARLPVMHGKERASLGEFFDIKGVGSEDIVLEGDLSRVKNIGVNMTMGRIQLHGDAGMHLGARMRGGEILAYQNAGDWVGAEMRGGKIHVRGNAGHCLGGAYRGSRYGMNRGLIVVEGNVGSEAGSAMRRGLVVVKKNAGDFTGAFMIAGSIVVFGKMGARPGAGLLRGTIIAFEKPELLPTYRYACRYNPSFLDLIFQSLRNQGISVPDYPATGCFEKFRGDFNRLGKGEILVYAQC